MASCSTSTSNVQVFVRVRPLTGDELTEQHSEIVFDTNIITNILEANMPLDFVEAKSITQSKASPVNQTMSWKSLRSLLNIHNVNVDVFSKAIQPALSDVLAGSTVCCFSYGHTGECLYYPLSNL